MLHYLILGGLAAGCLHLGAKGLLKGKIPFSATKTISGTPARLIGGICALVGLGLGLLLLSAMAE